MAAEPRNLSGGTRWSNGDIFQLVALLIGIPAAIAAVIMLVMYYRRRSQGRRGETPFPQYSWPHRPLGASSASHIGGLPSPLCDSCCALKAETSDETASFTTNLGSKLVCSCAYNYTSRWRVGSANL
jgi:hypothetical protein